MEQNNPIIPILVEFLQESKNLQQLHMKQTFILKRSEREHPDIINAIQELETKFKNHEPTP